MNDSVTHQAQSATARTRFAPAIWTLLLLAPFIGELLSGSTRASILFVYVPEVMVWGVGALFCRELVRRWRAGGVSLLLLGLALSIAEEFIIQQTSLAPLPFPGSNAGYGRMWGVNLVYLLFMLGYESVWVVVVPVQVTELFFPAASPRAMVAPARDNYLLCVFSSWKPHRLVWLDAAGTASIGSGAVSSAGGDDRAGPRGDCRADRVGLSRPRVGTSLTRWSRHY